MALDYMNHHQANSARPRPLIITKNRVSSVIDGDYQPGRGEGQGLVEPSGAIRLLPREQVGSWLSNDDRRLGNAAEHHMRGFDCGFERGIVADGERSSQEAVLCLFDDAPHAVAVEHGDLRIALSLHRSPS